MQNRDNESQDKCTNNRVIMNTVNTITFTIETVSLIYTMVTCFDSS